MSVERQTKEKFPKQRRLYKQRRSTVASIRSCPARCGVCGTCQVYGLYWCFGSVVRPFLSGASWSVYNLRRSNYICETQKNARVLQNASVYFLLLFFWCCFVCISSSFRCICFGSRRFSLYVSVGNGSSSYFLIHNRLLY